MRGGGKKGLRRGCLPTVFFAIIEYEGSPISCSSPRCADRFAALGAEPRLQIGAFTPLAHPTGMVAGEVQEELGFPRPPCRTTWKSCGKSVWFRWRRAGTFLWYTANTDALREVLGFLYEECCTRNRARLRGIDCANFKIKGR